MKTRHNIFFAILLLAVLNILGPCFHVDSLLISAHARQIPESRATTPNGPLCLVAESSESEAFVGQEFMYTLKFYRLCRIDDLSLVLPDVTGVSFIPLGAPRRYRKKISDNTYDVIEIRYSLVASKTGTLVIPSAIMSMRVFTPGLDTRKEKSIKRFYRAPFFVPARGRYLSISSNPIKVTILPLPRNRVPENFMGMVGKYKMTAKISPRRVGVGETSTLTIRVEGIGLVDKIPILKLPRIEGLRVYAEKPAVEMNLTPRGMYGSKTMKWAIVATRAGAYVIPSFSVAYFNIETQQYSYLKSPQLLLEVVTPSKNRSGSGLSMEETLGGKEAVKNIAIDICPIHTSIRESIGSGSNFTQRPLMISSLFIPPIIYFLFYAWFTIRKKLTDPTSHHFRKNARRRFKKKIGQGKITSIEVLKAFNVYLNERFGVSMGTITSEECRKILLSHGISEELALKFKNIIGKIEKDVFTGRGSERCEVVQGLSTLIDILEKASR